METVAVTEYVNLQQNNAVWLVKNDYILNQTPNAIRNDAEFDRTRFSRRTKMTNVSKKTASKHFETISFVCL